MQVKSGDRLCLDARAAAEPADDLLFHDYYTRTPQIRLTGDVTGEPTARPSATEVTLDGPDVAAVVACALRHPSPNMRQWVLTAIWNHPDSFAAIFRFGLEAPGTFTEIRKIVAEELDKHAARSKMPAANPEPPASKALLPQMPLPAHLRDRRR